MDKHTPKFKVGDKVFLLKDSKIIQETVLGVLALFDDDFHSYEKKKIKFDHFAYFFNIRRCAYQYDWVEEEKVFNTKEELIATL